MKKLCDKFGLENMFHRKYPNHEQFKIYQEGTTFLDCGITHPELIDKIDRVTCEPFGYRKGRGNYQGWSFDILETALFGNKSTASTRPKVEASIAKIVNKLQYI